jgi:hypothetical protein
MGKRKAGRNKKKVDRNIGILTKLKTPKRYIKLGKRTF